MVFNQILLKDNFMIVHKNQKNKLIQMNLWTAEENLINNISYSNQGNMI